MPRRYECPRCGAGTNPADSQCWRCGELLVTRQAANESVAAKVSAVEETMEQSALVVLTKEDRKKAAR